MLTDRHTDRQTDTHTHTHTHTDLIFEEGSRDIDKPESRRLCTPVNAAHGDRLACDASDTSVT